MSKYLDDMSLFQGEDADEDDAYQVLSTLKRITAFHKYEIFLSGEPVHFHLLQLTKCACNSVLVSKTD